MHHPSGYLSICMLSVCVYNILRVSSVCTSHRRVNATSLCLQHLLGDKNASVDLVARLASPVATAVAAGGAP